jgi:outer membrane protein TolC
MSNNGGRKTAGGTSQQIFDRLHSGVTRVSPQSILGVAFLGLMVSLSAAGQTNQLSANFGSVPSGTASAETLHLTLRDAITMALRYNLGRIESGENERIARGQRLRAMSVLLPQANAGIAENVEQFSAATLGIRIPQVPAVIGPFSYSAAQASASQSLINFESIQRFRAARNAERAAQLTYNDTLDVITLVVGNAYLEVIQANSRIEAEEAQVKNAQALYDQAADQLQSGTSTKIDVTRSGVQLHTEQYNLSIAQNNFAIAKLNLSRAIGLPLGQAFDLADQVPYADINPPTVEEALNAAYKARSGNSLPLAESVIQCWQPMVTMAYRGPILAASMAPLLFRQA